MALFVSSNEKAESLLMAIFFFQCPTSSMQELSSSKDECQCAQASQSSSKKEIVAQP